MDPLDLHFKISDIDDASDPKYYGFLNSKGNFYIQREDSTLKQFRYFYGESGYATAWTGRAGLSYDYFNVIF